MPISKPRRNVYDILTRDQIWAVVELVESGIEDTLFKRDSHDDYTQEDIDGINAKVERGTEAIELFVADLRPNAAQAHAVAQLDVLDLRTTAESKLFEMLPGVKLALQKGTNQLLVESGEAYNAGATTIGDDLRAHHREARAALDDSDVLEHTSSEVISAARAVLGAMGEDGGWRGGEFESALIRAFDLADNENAARLASAFPAMAVAIQRRRSGGPDGLRALLPAKIQ